MTDKLIEQLRRKRERCAIIGNASLGKRLLEQTIERLEAAEGVITAYNNALPDEPLAREYLEKYKGE